MSEEKFKDRYRIPSTRAAWHDYLGGAYFVTICTKGREFFLGKIEDEQMHLSEIGKYAEEQFQDVSSNYPYAEIPSFVVMPNHIHAIVIIDDRHNACRDVDLSRLLNAKPPESTIHLILRPFGNIIRNIQGRFVHILLVTNDAVMET